MFIFFLSKKKETCHRCDIARKFDTYFVKFFPALSLPFNSLREEPKVEKNKMFLAFTFIWLGSNLKYRNHSYHTVMKESIFNSVAVRRF